MKGIDVVTMGEMLIDFICTDIGVSIVDGVNFSKKAGGAPANVAAGIAKLGGSAGFIGKVGDDSFGKFLKKTLEEASVDTENLILDNKYKTSLAFVSLKSNGERDFEFIREPGADTMLEFDEINTKYIDSLKIIHYGSISLIGGPMKETTLKVLEYCRMEKKIISYDPNLRLNLWESEEAAKEGILLGMKYADIVKVSEEELEFITDEKQVDRGIAKLHKMGPKIIFVTFGKDGAVVSNQNQYEKVGGYAVKAIDTTGAGDGFTAGILYMVSQEANFDELIGNFERIKKITQFANKVGAIVTTRYGAISAMPSIEEINNF